MKLISISAAILFGLLLMSFLCYNKKTSTERGISMKLISIPVTMLSENVYLYFDEATKTGVIIDPGGEPDKIINKINECGISITAILLTHGHYDHTGAVHKIKELTNAPVCVHKDESGLLRNPKSSLSSRVIEPDVLLDENTDIPGVFGGRIKVIHTPGHTSGSVCYYDAEESILFSGDTIFFESIGRTDFPTGDAYAIIPSIKNKIFTLPDETVIYPGHEERTSVGHEKRNNPFVR